MMCSTWKISVFGIVALMLAFGLAAGDAFAHSDGHSDHPSNIVQHFTDATLTVTAISSETTDPRLANGNGDGRKDRSEDLLTAEPEDRLKATEVLDALVFTYTAGRTPVKEKAITITIPSGWTPATKDVDDGVHRVGEVELLVAGVPTRDKLVVSSRSMKFTGIDPALNPGDEVVFWFKRVTVPVRADSYEFGVISEMTGPKHVNKLNPHLAGEDAPHAIQLDADTDDPNAHDHGKVGTITLVVDEHTHPDDATHQHVDGVSLVDPPAGHSSHSTDHTHDTETKTVVTVEGHTHPFNDGFQPHQHDADNGTVYTSKASDPDLHTHTDDPFKDTHAHNEDGNVDTEEVAHDVGDGESQHTHDTDKSVADVATHTHPAGSIMDHAHATTGRRGIDALTAVAHDDDDEEDANVHTHVLVGGKVDLNAHTHSGHNRDHGHPAVAENPDVAALPTGRHETDTHYHVSAGGEVAGVSGHKHTNSNGDPIFYGHGHRARGDGVTVDGIDPVSHDDDAANLHMHKSNGLIADVGIGHTHSNPTAANSSHRIGAGYTKTHQHSAIGIDSPPAAAQDAVVPLLEGTTAHTATARGHTPFYFRSGAGAVEALPVHTHTGTGGTMTRPTAPMPDATTLAVGDITKPWGGITLTRFFANNIAYHTHDGRGKADVVTAHTHGANVDNNTGADEAITVTIIDHKHQTGRDCGEEPTDLPHATRWRRC